METTASRYPLQLTGALAPRLSRGLWLVKWLLAIPHFVVLLFLWIAFAAVSVVAFFAILFTGRYPRVLFDFNVGVLRWSWRVGFYSYSALGTDRYPPFTLQDVPDYPARLEVAYPEQLSRGLVLVKWWLLAIPHYIVTGIFLGGGSYAAAQVDDWFWGIGFETGLIGILVLFAGVALLFTTRYPGGLFDLAVGLDRWVARVAAYVLLMRDEYPPFRLDQGGTEGEGFAEPAAAFPDAPIPGEPTAPAEPPARRGWTGGRIALVVVGTITGLLALGLLVGGCALIAVDQTQRDDDGFLMSPTEDFSTPTYAIVSESADLGDEGAERALDVFLGTVRIRSESDRPVFVGIGPAGDVTRYVGGVERDVVDDLDHDGDPECSRRSGGEPTGRPGNETFWVASTAGAGERTLDWEPEDGDWRAVVMNEDASRGVSSELSIGAELDSIIWIAIGLLIAGALLATASALAITAATRGRR